MGTIRSWQVIGNRALARAEDRGTPAVQAYIVLDRFLGYRILEKRKAVFVVEDDPSVLKGVNRLLRQYGFDTVLFDSAAALRKRDRFDDAFCIILDIDLGDGSGIDLHNQLKATGISLPVIYITGNDNDATRVAALQSGCIAYLTKPFVAKSLIEPIEMASAASA
jgi:FixJ family two-component response regulator